LLRHSSGRHRTHQVFLASDLQTIPRTSFRRRRTVLGLRPVPVPRRTMDGSSRYDSKNFDATWALRELFIQRALTVEREAAIQIIHQRVHDRRNISVQSCSLLPATRPR